MPNENVFQRSIKFMMSAAVASASTSNRPLKTQASALLYSEVALNRTCNSNFAISSRKIDTHVCFTPVVRQKAVNWLSKVKKSRYKAPKDTTNSITS